jgi:EAL domain-containing protein (putative c-di-GMP-specific phosphodiesterase class I)/GGDEF domain-containing protein
MRIIATRLLSLFLLATMGLDATALTLNSQAPQQPVQDGVAMLIEQPNMSIEQVLAEPAQNWQHLSGDINAGYTNVAHWYRLQLRNPSSMALPRLLEIAYPQLDLIDYYQVQNQQIIQSFSTGDTLPFTERPLLHRNFVFPLTIPANTMTEIYLRVQTAGAHQVPLMLWEERAFHANSEKGLAGRSLFYGILLVMAAFNLFLYFSLREKTYLLYVMVVVPMLLLMTAMHGVSFQYLYPQSPRLHEMMILTMVPVALLTLTLFTVGFFDLRSTHPGWYRVFLVLMGLAGLCILGAFVLPYGLSTRLSVFLALPVCAANIAAGIMLWSSGARSARLFSLGWLALLGGSVLMVLNKLGVLPSLFITEHGIPLGAAAQSLVFSFALASRFHQEREARMAAVDAQQQAQIQFLHAASHNAITGLPNQILFEKKVSELLTHTTGELAITVLQLRHYEDVQKTLGHQHSAALQQEIAARLNQALRGQPCAATLESDATGPIHAAHLEGGRFAFAAQCPQRNGIQGVIDDLSRNMSRAISFHGLELEFGFHFGITVRDHRQDVPTLLREAGIAFEQAGKSSTGIMLYRESMSPYNTRRLDLMTDLRFAIEQDALIIHYQPRIDLKQGGVDRLEALLRWHHPEHGDISPAEFIPLAESTGLILPLTRWILRHALSFADTLNEANTACDVSINISAANLHEPGFCQHIISLLETHGAPRGRLMLEITGASEHTDSPVIRDTLNALRQAGVMLALDDYGSEAHALTHIRKLPLNDLMLASDFVQRMSKHQEDATIIRASVEMCHQLGFRTVAEGVEDSVTLNALKEIGCDLAQGYHICKPLPAKEAMQWLQSSTWARRTTPRLPSDASAVPT